MLTNTNDWERCDKSGLVSIGSYSLFASTSGPPRRPHAPVVIFITGGGAPTEFYVHLQDAISKFARTYFFDRAGYGRSERPTSDRNSRCGCPKEEVVDGAANKPRGVWWPLGSLANSDINGTQDCRSISAEDSAFELHRLMEAIDVQPPYVLAAHSYGGIIARTYYGLFPNHIAGMALLDTNSELLQQCLSPMPPPAFKKVTSDVDPEEVLHLREASGMSDEEWEAAMAAIVRTIPASTSEATFSSGRDLARRMQIDRQAMCDKPLIIMRSNMATDWRLYLTRV